MTAFKTQFAEHIFQAKYAQGQHDTWEALSKRVVEDVCGSRWGTDTPLLPPSELDELQQLINQQKFIPGGRYLYYAGRPVKAYNNCYLLKGESDTREEWGNIVKRASDCLMSGGGIGVDYSVFRASGAKLQRTGGHASGPIPLMNSVNEVGRNVMQGGSRRSAIWAGLSWQHDDVDKFLHVKDWHHTTIGAAKHSDGRNYTLWDAKQDDYNFPAPLDMTNISVNYDDKWLGESERHTHPIFRKNCEQALKGGEPGFGFNFGKHTAETLRNACTEVTSADDSDVCNLGSINIGNIETVEEFKQIVRLASKFLVCGTVRAELPYKKVYEIREKNRRLGLGLMGIHEWLLKRKQKYEVTEELKDWLRAYRKHSVHAADQLCNTLSISQPVAYRSIAPTGTIGIMACTTTGIEPLFAVAYKRRYLSDFKTWKFEYVVDSTAEALISQYGLDPRDIDTAYRMANDYERRIRFQADVQDYVDMAISSTINLPAYGSVHNNEDTVADFAYTLSKYAPRLRGFTCYPDGSRGGQPLEEADYTEAKAQAGVVFEDNDSCKGGVCGI